MAGAVGEGRVRAAKRERRKAKDKGELRGCIVAASQPMYEWAIKQSCRGGSMRRLMDFERALPG